MKEEEKKNYKNNPQTINKMAISTHLSIITLNVNVLNALIKRHRVAEGLKKNKTHIYAAYENSSIIQKKTIKPQKEKQKEKERNKKKYKSNRKTRFNN